MEVKSFEEGGVAVFQVEGEINIGTSPELRKLFEKQSLTKIIIDLQKVSYIDSSGLATLVDILKKLKAKSGSLALAGMSDKIKTLFEITKLTKLFSIYPDRAQAAAQMQK